MNKYVQLWIILSTQDNYDKLVYSWYDHSVSGGVLLQYDVAQCGAGSWNVMSYIL